MLALCAVGCSVFGAVPVHLGLQRHHDDQDINLLERWHWLRTAAWLGCALLALAPL